MRLTLCGICDNCISEVSERIEMTPEAVQKLVDSWGAMGVLWGINRSMARVHALLIASDEPLSLDEISEQLEISRGNASMCLKELRNWRVIQRVHKPGDRRDYYVPEQDVLRMFFRIATERKKREFDPALAAVRQALQLSPEQMSDEVRARLQDMEELLSSVDELGRRFLADEDAARGILKFLTDLRLPKDVR
jgi:DNA-binding transcriptional regulator GbsR (MarR family)